MNGAMDRSRDVVGGDLGLGSIMVMGQFLEVISMGNKIR